MINNNHKHIETKLKVLPTSPGVYQYFDKNNKIIYVGKAKNLKKRVTTYFNKSSIISGKIKVLVSKIYDIQWVITETEYDALLLENNLIKEYQPKYNVLLKDDKSYPWICIKNEHFPRIFPTRRLVKDGSQYFGPFPSVKTMNILLNLIKQIYNFRTCSLNLSVKNIENGKYKPCLEYQIGNCLAPCFKLQTEDEYIRNIFAAKQIIKGNLSEAKNRLISAMTDYAQERQFEKAQQIKEKLELIKNYQSKSLVVSSAINNVDVFSITETDKSAFVNYMIIVDGSIVQSHNFELVKKLDETKEELLSLAITELTSRYESLSMEIIVPFMPEFLLQNKKYTIPLRGDKKKLIELSTKNATFYKLEKQKQKELTDPNKHINRILEKLRNDLNLSALPKHIECFDNSNIQGKFPVAAMSVFKNAKPSKKDYRHFNIKTVVGANDYASMEEIIYRRYKRLIDENINLPQLIVIDGGKGQLKSAMNSLKKLNIDKKVAVLGIAKRLEEIYFPYDPIPLYLDKKSESLKLIQQLRDEAHRFGITHHRNKRSKETIKTELTNIKGIGNKTATILLTHFKSIEKIKNIEIDEITTIIGNHKAKILNNYFKLNNGN